MKLITKLRVFDFFFSATNQNIWEKKKLQENKGEHSDPARNKTLLIGSIISASIELPLKEYH